MSDSKKSSAVEVDLNVTASEESKGGIKYEVVIGEPKVVTPPRVTSPVMSRTPLSAEVIQQKLEAAAERRQSLEAEKLAFLAEKMKRIEEATKKKEEEESVFIKSTKEALEQKMQAHIENRESKVVDLKTKLSHHNTNHLNQVRQNQESSVVEKEEKAEKELISKLEAADKNREKVFQERLESLKKHDEKVEMIRNKMSTSVNLEADNETASSGWAWIEHAAVGYHPLLAAVLMLIIDLPLLCTSVSGVI